MTDYVLFKADLCKLLLNMELLLPPLFLYSGESSQVIEYQSEKLEEIWRRPTCDLRSGIGSCEPRVVVRNPFEVSHISQAFSVRLQGAKLGIQKQRQKISTW